MNRLMLIGMALLAMTATAATPDAEQAGIQAANYSQESQEVTYPGSSCIAMAWEQYGLVLSDPDNGADHYYLAETYRVMGEHALEC